MVRGGAERREEHEMLDPGVLGRPQQPPGRHARQLLDRRVGLVAVRGREVDDRPHAAHRLAQRPRVGQVADGDLDAHPLGPEAARIADQAADRLAARREAPQERGADEARGAGKEQHESL